MFYNAFCAEEELVGELKDQSKEFLIDKEVVVKNSRKFWNILVQAMLTI